MNTEVITETEIHHLATNAAGWFVDEEGDLCYLYGQEQISASISAEDRLVSLITSGAIDIASTDVDVSAVQSTIGVSRVPDWFATTIEIMLDSIEDRAGGPPVSTSNTEDFLSQLHAEGFQATLEDLHALTAATPELFFANWPDDGDAWIEDGMTAIREQLTLENQ